MPEQFELILRNATCVWPERVEQTDVGIRGGMIAAIGDLGSASAAEVVDLAGLHLLPGLIDSHVHFREPGYEHKEDLESGSRAAVMGGVTTFFEMPNTKPNTTTSAALQDKLSLAEGRCWANYGFYIGATTENLADLSSLEQLPGTPGVKMFMGSSTGSLLVDREDDQRRVMENGTRPVAVHAEDEARLLSLQARMDAGEILTNVASHPIVRDPEAAVIATTRLLELSRETGRPVHILHVTTMQEPALIATAKHAGIHCTCEVTPQHLALTDEAYTRLGTRVQMNPPIRHDEHQRALWAALQAGTFDTFGSDHAPHSLEEKAREYPQSPSGIPGVQTMLPLLLEWRHQRRLDLGAIVRMASHNPAQIFGVDRRGSIEIGQHADLVAVDLSKDWTIDASWLQSKCGWSPFEGMRIHGAPIHTIVQGEFSVLDQVICGQPKGREVQFTWKQRNRQ